MIHNPWNVVRVGGAGWPTSVYIPTVFPNGLAARDYTFMNLLIYNGLAHFDYFKVPQRCSKLALRMFTF